MNVVGTRIRIRPSRKEDLAFLQALWNDGAVMRYRGYPDGMHVTTEGLERWWAMTPQGSARAVGALVAPHCLIEQLDGTPLGEFTYSLDAHQRVHVDLKLAAAYWGQGYAQEALEVAIRDLFATTAAKLIVVEPATDNLPAQQLCRRSGFQPAPSENHPDRWCCSRSDFAQHRHPLTPVS
jgi:RimJ/RimL family protein N-acetyltransferase